MNVLSKIIAEKRIQIEAQRKQVPIDQLIQYPNFELPKKSFSESIRNGNGIIAEFKRKSPSAGEFHSNPMNEILGLYKLMEVSACSILTDETHFGGSLEDLSNAKTFLNSPILRKDFVVDEYQLFEAKAHGADAVLLIAAALDEYHTTHLTTIAHSLDLEVLFEIHSKEDVDKLNENVDVIGVNNRNLKTLKTDIETSERLLKYLPFSKVKISESGLKSAADLQKVYDLGFDGCLIGESILKRPALLEELRNKANEFKLLTHEN